METEPLETVEISPEPDLVSVEWQDEELQEEVQKSLSPRLCEVLDQISRGISHAQIAQNLDISPYTVRKHSSAILVRLEISNIIQAVNVGFERGILVLDIDDEGAISGEVPPKITPIEGDELIAAAKGLGTVAAAMERGVAAFTVSDHRKHIIKKLNASNMAHAVRLARQAGISTTPEQIFEPEVINRKLSPRELEILDLASRGLKNKAMARVLGISKHTISKHRVHLLQKLDAFNIVEAVNLGFERGLLTQEPGDSSDGNHPKITKIERQEILLAARGLEASEAARERGVAETSVVKNRIRIRKKLGALTMEHTMRLARETGISFDPEV